MSDFVEYDHSINRKLKRRLCHGIRDASPPPAAGVPEPWSFFFAGQCYCNRAAYDGYASYCDLICPNTTTVANCACKNDSMAGEQCDERVCADESTGQLWCISGEIAPCQHHVNKERTTPYPWCPCLNHGSRRDSPGTGCLCKPGYGGQFCQARTPQVKSSGQQAAGSNASDQWPVVMSNVQGLGLETKGILLDPLGGPANQIPWIIGPSIILFIVTLLVFANLYEKRKKIHSPRTDSETPLRSNTDNPDLSDNHRPIPPRPLFQYAWTPQVRLYQPESGNYVLLNSTAVLGTLPAYEEIERRRSNDDRSAADQATSTDDLSAFPPSYEDATKRPEDDETVAPAQ